MGKAFSKRSKLDILRRYSDDLDLLVSLQLAKRELCMGIRNTDSSVRLVRVRGENAA